MFTLVSRITGLAREIAIAWWLGNSWISSRLDYAFMIPNLFRRLFGEGALSAAFIPVFQQNLTTQGRERAEKLFGNVATLLTIILTTLTVILLLVIAGLWLFTEHTDKRTLTLALTALMVPYMIFVCLVALLSAMMNCLDRFGLPAFVPIILNIFQIAAIVFGRNVMSYWTDRQEIQVYAVGVGVLLSGVVQLAMMVRAMRRMGMHWRWDASLNDPDLRAILGMILPVIFGIGMLQFGAYFDGQVILMLSGEPGQTFTVAGHTIAYPLDDGDNSAVVRAQRLYQFPLGVLAISLATAAFPLFSRYAAEGNMLELGRSVTRGMCISIAEGLPCGIGMLVLAEPIVSVVLQRGDFSADDTIRTSHVLRMYCIGLWAYCAQQIILRAFYSLKDMTTPLKVMVAALGLNILMNVTLLWVPALNVGAFGLSTSVVWSATIVALCVIFAKRYGRIDSRQVMTTFMKSLVASLVMAAAAWSADRWLALPNKYAHLAMCLSVSVAVYVAAAYALKIGEVAEMLGMLRRKVGKKKAAAESASGSSNGGEV